MSKKERLAKRNQDVRKLFDKLISKHPQWRIDAIIEKVAEQFYLSPRTIEAIIKWEKEYNY